MLEDPQGGFIQVEPTLQEHLKQCEGKCREYVARISHSYWLHLKAVLREYIIVFSQMLAIPLEELVEMLRTWPSRPKLRAKMQHWETFEEIMLRFMESNGIPQYDMKEMSHELGDDMYKEIGK